MKNPFTYIKNKFIETYESARGKIFRQRQKDTGTKKETARGKSGGGGNTSKQTVTEKHIVTEFLSQAQRKRKRKARIKRKMARRSRRINRLRKVA